MTPQEFLPKALQAAKDGGHVWPEYAACEAALESAWGGSKLCIEANNLFGQKQGFSTAGVETIEIPTREFLQAQWAVVNATWPKFASWSDSFKARMTLLNRLPLYHDALQATDGATFVALVSKHWSTDPERATKVLQIFRAHQKELFPTQSLS